jgi:hypothetical protein
MSAQSSCFTIHGTSTRSVRASIALQRQRLASIVDDWSVMTDEEKKRVLQMIFSEIRADHTDDGLKIEFRPKPIWEPYTEAVLARQRQEQTTSPAVTTSERKTGGQARGSGNSSAPSGRAWVAPTGRLTLFSRRARTREAVKGRHRTSGPRP